MSIYDDVLACEELINNCFDPETGEVFQDQENIALEMKQEIVEQGLEKLCKVRANFMAEAEALKAEEKRIATKRKVAENKQKFIERYIQNILELSGSTKVIAGTFTCNLRMSEQVRLEDGFENKSYGVYEFKADKLAIKKALKQGETIEGASIVLNLNLNIK